MNNTNLICELIQAIHQTDEWDRIWMQDPAIQEARTQLDAIFDSIEPKELRDKLLDTTFNLTSVCEETAIRYGARVTLALLNAAEQVVPRPLAITDLAQLQTELAEVKEQLRISEAARKLALEQRDRTATDLGVKLGKVCRRAEDAEDEVVRLWAQLYNYMTAEA